MGSPDYLIQKKTPKKLLYIKTLLDYNKPGTLLEKAKSYFKKDVAGPHTKWQWMEIVGSTKNNGNCEQFMDHLIKKNVLVEEGTTGNPPNETEVYSLDKQQLIQVFYESSYYSWNRDLFFKTINEAEPNKKIVSDF